MSVIVKVTCDRDVGEGTCPASAYGRVGEDIPRTLMRAGRAGWLITSGHCDEQLPIRRTLCPLHAHGTPGGTGPL
jgi:hypothetical protein